MNCILYDKCNHIDCEKDFCEKKFRTERLYDYAKMSWKQRQHIKLVPDNNAQDIESFKRLHHIEQDIINFIAKNKHLFIYSAQCGNGKSSWAARMLQSYFDKIWVRADLSCHGLFIHVPSFLNQVKASISVPSEEVDYIKENILKAEIVVWDEIAEKPGTEFELNLLLSLINQRINAGKTNIYTANRLPAELSAILGERLASRIANESVNVQLFGKDKRASMTGKDDEY